MSLPKFNPRTLSLLLMMTAVAAIRVALAFASHYNEIAQFTPLGAMAIFAGAYFSGRWKPFAFPLLTLFASDLVLSFTLYSSARSGLLYTGWYWTYAAFALMAIAGKWLIREVNIKSVLIAVITVTLIHWLVSDLGGCFSSSSNQSFTKLYLSSLIAAIPFELRFLTGTLLYSALLFGSFEWMQKKYAYLAI